MIFLCNDWAPPDFTEAILAIVTMFIKLCMKFIMQAI